MESFGDKARAFAYAIGIHALCVLAMLIGLWWTTESRPVSVPGPIIQVDLIGPTQAPKSVAVSSPKPVTPPKPTFEKPEPPKIDTPKPTPPKLEVAQPPTPPPTEVHQDRVEQERIAALAE